mgnify:CR=1 FL=1|jgi:hypothetical protein
MITKREPMDKIIVNGLEFRSRSHACHHYGVSWTGASKRVKAGLTIEEAIRILRSHRGLVLLNPHHMKLICSQSWGCNETTTLAKLTQGRRT